MGESMTLHVVFNMWTQVRSCEVSVQKQPRKKCAWCIVHFGAFSMSKVDLMKIGWVQHHPVLMLLFVFTCVRWHTAHKDNIWGRLGHGVAVGRFSKYSNVLRISKYFHVDGEFWRNSSQKCEECPTSSFKEHPNLDSFWFTTKIQAVYYNISV